MVVIDSSVNKNRDRWIFEDIETRLAGVQSKSFNTETNITTEKIFNVASAAPRVISSNVTIVGAEHGSALTGTLHDVHQRRIRRKLGVGERIGTKEIQIPFAIAVPIGTGRRRDLLHLFVWVLVGPGNLGEIAEPRGHGRFGFGAFAAEEPGKSNKDIGHRRIVRAAKQRRDVQASLRRRFPRDGWTDCKAVYGIAARILRRDIPIFHFYSDFRAFVRHENGCQRSLREAPLAPTVAGVLFFKEAVHGPFNALEEILGKEQTDFIGVRDLWRAALFLFSSSRRRRNFFMSKWCRRQICTRRKLLG